MVYEEGDMADVIPLQLYEFNGNRDRQADEKPADLIIFPKQQQIPNHYRLKEKNIPPADRNRKCSNPKCFEKACLLFEWEIQVVNDPIGGDIYHKYPGDWNELLSCHDKKCIRYSKKTARLNLIAKFSRNCSLYLPLHK